MRAGRFTIAAEAFEDAERLYTEQWGPFNPKVSEAIAYRAWCYAKSGRASDAVALYEDAIDRDLKRGGARGQRVEQLREQLEWARSKLTH
jgi:tetratricopeptide (TPR) repeat protein